MCKLAETRVILFQDLNPLNSNLTPDKTPILYMNNTYPNDESPEDKWNQPEADSKHYLAFDFHKVRFQKKRIYTVILAKAPQSHPSIDGINHNSCNKECFCFNDHRLIVQFSMTPGCTQSTPSRERSISTHHR